MRSRFQTSSRKLWGAAAGAFVFLFVGKQYLFHTVSKTVKDSRDRDNAQAQKALQDQDSYDQFRREFRSFLNSQDQRKLNLVREKYRNKGVKLENAYLEDEE